MFSHDLRILFFKGMTVVQDILKSLPNKEVLLVAVLTLFLYLVIYVATCIGPIQFAGRYGSETAIFMSILSFLLLIYFIPETGTVKKSVIYCVTIPFSIITILGILLTISEVTSFAITYENHVSTTKRIYNIISENLILIVALYVEFGLGNTLSMMFICLFHLHLLKSGKPRPEDMSIYCTSLQLCTSDLRLFKHKKFTLAVGFVLIVFLVVHYVIFRKFFNKGSKLHSSIIFDATIFSFLSILYLAPVIFDNIKKTILCCIALPFFWCKAVYGVYVALLFIVVWDEKWYKIGASLADRYLGFYIEDRIWSISLLLLLIYGIYYYFTKLELARKKTK
jgi:hypothetical protein